jgi:hypothetical protein
MTRETANQFLDVRKEKRRTLRGRSANARNPNVASKRSQT